MDNNKKGVNLGANIWMGENKSDFLLKNSIILACSILFLSKLKKKLITNKPLFCCNFF